MAGRDLAGTVLAPVVGAAAGVAVALATPASVSLVGAAPVLVGVAAGSVVAFAVGYGVGDRGYLMVGGPATHVLVGGAAAAGVVGSRRVGLAVLGVGGVGLLLFVARVRTGNLRRHAALPANPSAIRRTEASVAKRLLWFRGGIRRIAATLPGRVALGAAWVALATGLFLGSAAVRDGTVAVPGAVPASDVALAPAAGFLVALFAPFFVWTDWYGLEGIDPEMRERVRQGTAGRSTGGTSETTGPPAAVDEDEERTTRERSPSPDSTGTPTADPGGSTGDAGSPTVDAADPDDGTTNAAAAADDDATTETPEDDRGPTTAPGESDRSPGEGEVSVDDDLWDPEFGDESTDDRIEIPGLDENEEPADLWGDGPGEAADDSSEVGSVTGESPGNDSTADDGSTDASADEADDEPLALGPADADPSVSPDPAADVRDDPTADESATDEPPTGDESTGNDPTATPPPSRPEPADSVTASPSATDESVPDDATTDDATTEDGATAGDRDDAPRPGDRVRSYTAGSPPDTDDEIDDTIPIYGPESDDEEGVEEGTSGVEAPSEGEAGDGSESESTTEESESVTEESEDEAGDGSESESATDESESATDESASVVEENPDEVVTEADEAGTGGESGASADSGSAADADPVAPPVERVDGPATGREDDGSDPIADAGDRSDDSTGGPPSVEPTRPPVDVDRVAGTADDEDERPVVSRGRPVGIRGVGGGSADDATPRRAPRGQAPRSAADADRTVRPDGTPIVGGSVDASSTSSDTATSTVDDEPDAVERSPAPGDAPTGGPGDENRDEDRDEGTAMESPTTGTHGDPATGPDEAEDVVAESDPEEVNEAVAEAPPDEAGREAGGDREDPTPVRDRDESPTERARSVSEITDSIQRDLQRIMSDDEDESEAAAPDDAEDASGDDATDDQVGVSDRVSAVLDGDQDVDDAPIGRGTAEEIARILAGEDEAEERTVVDDEDENAEGDDGEGASDGGDGDGRDGDGGDGDEGDGDGGDGDGRDGDGGDGDGRDGDDPVANDDDRPS